MLNYLLLIRTICLRARLEPRRTVRRTTAAFPFWLATAALGLFVLPVRAQQNDEKNAPVVVQPGAPGQATRKLPASTRAILPPHSKKDVEFMQLMIIHHGQAVEMTDLIKSRTENKEIRRLGARISQSQSDEITFMRSWLRSRGQPLVPSVKEGAAGHMNGEHSPSHDALMPGMLSAKQMEALKTARGSEFDRLFLAGMIQHHEGALAMVKELFETPGAGQDAELFNFATDVDSGQRAEIKIMQKMLGEKP
jgi:uncharacterized protein (DUF305 family)